MNVKGVYAIRYCWSVTQDGWSMTAEDNTVDEFLREVYCTVVGLILLDKILDTEIDKHKEQKPRRKPKGKWRFKQYEEWDKK